MRFLPLELFALIEAFTILSLLNAPAPWFSGALHSGTSMVISVVLGVCLALVAFLSAVLGAIRFETHLRLAGGIGVVLIALALFGGFIPESAAALFGAYAGLLILGSLLTRKPAAGRVAALPVRPVERPLGEAGAREERRRAA